LPDIGRLSRCEWKSDRIGSTGQKRQGYDARMSVVGTKNRRTVSLAAETEQVKVAAIRDGTPAGGPVRSSDWFGRFAAQASTWLGSKWAFAGAGLIIVIWALTGPIFKYSDTWQLVINTGTTIVTFLMVFLIQNTQNRDARAINLKLNELIHAIDAARDQMIDIESLSDLELSEIQARFEKIKAAAAAKVD
jgi:low affinity Fe/Cu permease